MKRILLISFLLLLSVMAFVSCRSAGETAVETSDILQTENKSAAGQEETPPPGKDVPGTEGKYLLSISVFPEGSGTVTPSSGLIEEGTEVTLSAAPSAGYVFDHWSHTAAPDSEVVVTMNEAKSIVAYFAPLEIPEMVTFRDSKLEEAIRGIINKPSGAITVNDLSKISSLELQNRGISDLTGLEYCVALTDLDVADNEITDISQLAGTVNLTVFNISGNRIVNLKPALNLPNIKEIRADSNGINTLPAMNSAPELKILSLNDNLITDISPVSKLDNLTQLYMSSNNISDLRPLSQLTTLKQLSLRSNRIVDLSPLTDLVGLELLDLSDNEISKLEPLSGMAGLRGLNLAVNRVSNLQVLSGLLNLKWLDLSYNNILDIVPLATLKGLWGLMLDANFISDVSPLIGYTELGADYLPEWGALQTSEYRLCLGLSFNQIASVRELLYAGLGEGDAINIAGNSLNVESIDKYVRAIRDDGVKVFDKMPDFYTEMNVEEPPVVMHTLVGRGTCRNCHDVAGVELLLDFKTHARFDSPVCLQCHQTP